MLSLNQRSTKVKAKTQLRNRKLTKLKLKASNARSEDSDLSPRETMTLLLRSSQPNPANRLNMPKLLSRKGMRLIFVASMPETNLAAQPSEA